TPFAYQAQALDGRPISGTVDATNLDDATRQLHAIGLRVLSMEPAARPTPRAKPLGGDDFIAFNEQLAHLTAVGMPIEQGLRLLAADLKPGRLAPTVHAVAEELDRGTPLDRAIEKYHDKFPPLYARLIDAGIKSNNLSAMLLSLGRHIETVQRL